MFTGIIQGVGEIVEISLNNNIASIKIIIPDVDRLQIGASVAINGVCLTVVSIEGNSVLFDVITETLDRTNLGELVKGDLVNVERSLKFGDEVGGHILSGHIMDTGLIHSKVKNGNQISFGILAPPSIHKFLSEKGYIAIDGISLTTGNFENGVFDLHIIPETLRLTTLGSKDIGDSINIEIDNNTQMIVQTVERLMLERGVY